MKKEERKIEVLLQAEADPHLELWYLTSEADVFEEAFGLPLFVSGVR